MRVAFYGRFSSDKQKDSSIDQQYRNCEGFADREGWIIAQRYEDRAISGSKGEEGRPGYKQMLADLKAKVFDVLLVDDMSRLSRDSDEANKTRKRFLFHGARLIAVSDGIDTNQKAHKLQAKAKELTNEIFLDQLKNQIKRGMIDQAERCFWNGGRVYGYRLVPVFDTAKQDPYGNPAKIGTRLEIEPEQAKWVRWIFDKYADGWSALKIVTELNRLDIPPPGSAYKKRRYQGKPSWNFLSLHGELERGTGLLNNRLYKGIYVWNRSYREKDPDTGRQVNRWRDKREWIEKPVEHLRIVGEELWNKAHERRVAVSKSVLALRSSEQCLARSTGRRPKYLFSGLLSCGVCHKPFTICEATKYGCSTVTTQGVYRCTNTLRVERKLVEELLLKPIQNGLFTQEGLDLFRNSFLKSVANLRRTADAEHSKIKARLLEVEREISHIMEAIKQGIFTATTKQALEQAEAERECLQKSLNHPHKSNGTLPAVLPDLAAWFKRSIGDLANLGPHQVDKARGIIKDLVGGCVKLEPTETSQGRALTAVMQPDYMGLARQLVGPKIILVAVGRIERPTRGL